MPSPKNSTQLVFSENVFVESVRTGRWLIIDELNRADIDKAFGELFTLFSGNRVRLSYRRQNLPIVLLPPGDEVDPKLEFPIYLLEDWRLLGTMNTFDKASLYQMSFAFMRRFAFVEIDIPKAKAYTQLISNKAVEKLTPPHCDEDLRDATVGLLQGVFASDADGSLRRLGLGVGPAIPLDVISYIRERYSLNANLRLKNDARDVVLEALEMYLYPQFEGKNDLHEEIVDSLSATLALSVEQRSKTGRILANWTGGSLQGA
jgi:hypothetical protein